jgi:acetolactate synthase regulatory subunit
MEPEFRQHVLAIGLRDRPGAVHSVAEVFSGRGLQMEAFFGTAGSQAADGDARALILFDATPERAEFVARVLRRLSAVRNVALIGPDDPHLVQSLLVAPPDSPPPEGVALAALPGGAHLAAGSPAAIRAWLTSPAPPERLGAMHLEWVGRA